MTDEKDIKLTIEAGEQTEPAVNEVSENQELADESPSLKEVIREQAIEDVHTAENPRRRHSHDANRAPSGVALVAHHAVRHHLHLESLQLPAGLDYD